MEPTPELIEAIGKAASNLLDSIGSALQIAVGGLTAFFTWKTKLEMEQLLAREQREFERQALMKKKRKRSPKNMRGKPSE